LEKTLIKESRIKAADLEIQAHFTSAGRLPPFRGATLRGAIGYNLRRTVCNNRSVLCKDCLLYQNCCYAAFFDGVMPENREFMRLYPSVPQPFMLILNQSDPTEIDEGMKFSFGIRLFGSSTELFPYVAYSLIEAGKNGLGRDRITFLIDNISQHGHETIYKHSENKVIKPQTSPLIYEESEPAKHLTLKLLTPVRIRIEGKTASELTFTDVVKTALRRLSILNYFYGSHQAIDLEDINSIIEESESVETTVDNLQEYAFKRYSGRQQTKVKLDGLTGDITFKDVPGKLVSILKLASRAGLGKSTSFGFGRIDIITERAG
jgi:CRISPR-associated endoribonuclease Cas6